AAAPGPARATALCGAGILAWLQGDFATARARLEESVALWRPLDDAPGLTMALTHLGLVFAVTGDAAAAETHYGESLEICRQGGCPAAGAVLAESLALQRELGDKRGVAWSRLRLGELAQARGDAAAGAALYGEGLALFHELLAAPGPAALLNWGLIWLLDHL